MTPLDRALWPWLSQFWADWKIRLRFVQPSTVIQWHRCGFQLFWRWKSRPRKPGRKTICPNTIDRIRQMSRANTLWGAPRIHGELLKLGLAVAQRSVAKYMTPRSRRPTSPNWRPFPRNHLDSMVSVDFLTVPTQWCIEERVPRRAAPAALTPRNDRTAQRHSTRLKFFADCG